MNLHNYEKASIWDVQNWIIEKLELTPYQKSKLIDKELMRFSSFQFMKRRKYVNNFWMRLTVIFIPVVVLVIFITLPINFFITGRWGYSYKTLSWLDKWKNNTGL